MSAALSETEADMLTRGREPVDKSSGKERKHLFTKKGVQQWLFRLAYIKCPMYHDLCKLLQGDYLYFKCSQLHDLRKSSCAYHLSPLVQPLQKNFSLAKWVQPAETSVEPGLGFLHTEPWQEKQKNKISDKAIAVNTVNSFMVYCLTVTIVSFKGYFCHDILTVRCQNASVNREWRLLHHVWCTSVWTAKTCWWRPTENGSSESSAKKKKMHKHVWTL